MPSCKEFFMFAMVLELFPIENLAFPINFDKIHRRRMSVFETCTTLSNNSILSMKLCKLVGFPAYDSVITSSHILITS